MSNPGADEVGGADYILNPIEELCSVPFLFSRSKYFTLLCGIGQKSLNKLETTLFDIDTDIFQHLSSVPLLHIICLCFA